MFLYPTLRGRIWVVIFWLTSFYLKKIWTAFYKECSFFLRETTPAVTFAFPRVKFNPPLNNPSQKCVWPCLKPCLHEQFLCDIFYLTIFICSREDEQNWLIFVWQLLLLKISVLVFLWQKKIVTYRKLSETTHKIGNLFGPSLLSVKREHSFKIAYKKKSTISVIIPFSWGTKNSWTDLKYAKAQCLPSALRPHSISLSPARPFSLPRLPFDKRA